MMKMRHNHISALLCSAVAAVAALFAGCQTGGGAAKPDGRREVEFSAMVRETETVQTRVLDSVYIESTPYDLDFHIEMDCKDAASGNIETIFGTYHVPPGYQGLLRSKDSGAPLEWQDLTSEHTFYAWTAPWAEAKPATDGVDEDGAYMTIKFEDSSEDGGYAGYQNGLVYEKFLGARSGPYTYSEHGKYVYLTFYHLVSKIRIGGMTLIKTDGSVEKHLKADIMFIGMPGEARFYPHPADDGRPVVKNKTTLNPDGGVTFFIGNDNEKYGEDVFYVCPELDFSNMGFRINLNDKDYGAYGDYYGSFTDVVFTRKAGDNYDSPNGGDSKILHAGEMMTLNFELIPGTGPGVSVVIQDWSTDEKRESVHHSKPGIYTDGEAADLVGLFGGDYTDEQVSGLFELYGEEVDGEDVFTLYDNVEVNGSSFPVGRDYVLEGAGHSIRMGSKSSQDMFDDHAYVTVGRMRNVYITDGTHTIWIDASGNIWLYDETEGEFVRSGHRLPAELDDGMNSFDIDLETGAFSQTASKS